MFQETSRKTTVMVLTTTFKFALSTSFDPDVESEDDARLSVLYSIAQYLDGIIWMPSRMADAHGRTLFGAGGTDAEDPKAVWPRVLGEVSL